MRRAVLPLALLFVAVFASEGFSQNLGNRFGSFGGGRRAFGGRTRYTSPSRPTVSPYLNYFRADNGAANGFYNFIQPYRQFQNQSNQFNSRLNTQGNQIGGLQRFQFGLQNQQGGRNGQRFDRRLTQRGVGASPTGKGATFMNYSHFFGGFGNRGAGQANGGRQRR